MSSQNAVLVFAHISVEDTLSRWRSCKDKVITKLLPSTSPCCNTNLNEANSNDEYQIWRVFYQRESDVTPAELEELRAFDADMEFSGQNDLDNHRIEVTGMAFGAWRELNRNVPSCPMFTNTDQVPRFVAVARRRPPWRGPIAVLVGLKYGGNIGSIIRTVVQANIFQAVHIVEERGTRTETSPLFNKTWGVSDAGKITGDVKEKFLSDKDISYYSMWNAPLIEIRRFKTVDQFLKAADEDNDNYCDAPRATICLDLGYGSFSLYSKDAIELFQSPGGKVMYLVIGAGDTGSPKKSLTVQLHLSRFLPCLLALMYPAHFQHAYPLSYFVTQVYRAFKFL